MEKNEHKSRRRKAREEAFILVFEKSFFDEGIDEIITRAEELRELVIDEYTSKVAVGIFEHIDEIDEKISSFLSKGWKIERISKVVLSVLRLSVYELMFLKDEVPFGVSINEAVELAKKYGDKDDYSFVNGILSSINRSLGAENKA